MSTETTAAEIDWSWRSELLGEPRVLSLPQGSLRCFVRGGDPTVVFAHGWLANASLWPIADAYSFTPEDQPERLAEMLAEPAATA